MASPLQRLLGKLRGQGRRSVPTGETVALLDGDHAVAAIEACLIEAAATSRAPWGSRAGALLIEQTDSGPLEPLAAGRLQAQTFASGREALSGAIGLALTGQRTSAFLAGHELLGAVDELQRATALHLPLVVQVTCRAAPAAGSSFGSSHEGYHAVQDCGCPLLFASSAQQAVDLSLIARQVSELALVPVVLALDAEATARSLQLVRLPSIGAARRLVAGPADSIDCPTPAQVAIFGKTRRRVPVGHDLDRPALLGATHSDRTWALAAAGQRAYFARHVPELLEAARQQFAELSGRRCEAVAEHRCRDADTLIVAQGVAAEAAAAAADYVRREHGRRVGAIDLRQLRPQPRQRLLELLHRKKTLVVLERSDSPLDDDPPLTRTLRALIQRATTREASDGPRWSLEHQPRLVSAIYGRGGLALRAADLVQLCQQLPETEGPIYLGLDFGGHPSQLPKRQAALDALRQSYPDVAALGVTADAPIDSRPEGTVSIGLVDGDAELASSLVPQLAQLLRRATGGAVRGSLPTRLDPFRPGPVSRLSWHPKGTAALPYVGDDEPYDLLLVPHDQRGALEAVLQSMRHQGALLIERSPLDTDQPLRLAAPLLAQIARRELSVHLCQLDSTEPGVAAQRGEHLLGAICATLATQQLVPLSADQVVTARNRELDPEDEALRHTALGALRSGLQGSRGARDGELVAAPPTPTRLPSIVRQLGQAESEIATPADSLTHFWNTVGLTAQARSVEQPSVDPMVSAGSVPPLSASLGGRADAERPIAAEGGAARRTLPQLAAERCTGCGVCWTSCPDGAIAALAIAPRPLIDAGLALAQQRGVDPGPLRPLVGKLAARVSALLRQADTPPNTGRALLESAVSAVLSAADLPADRATLVEQAGEALTEVLADLAITRAAPFFEAGEQQASGKGEILALAIDPDCCKGCGLCVANCEPGALSTDERSPADLAQQRRRVQLWEDLPDTSGETIARVAETEVGPLAATLLSRHTLRALAPSDGAEPGSGAKIALRAALAVTEYEQQRVLARQLEGLQRLRDDVATRTREQLANALPTSDLNALAAGIQDLDRSHVSLGELTTRVEQVVERGDVDAVQLGRLVQAARDLADLHWRLSRGVHGLGRARYGLVMTEGRLNRGIASYPHNPFQVPTLIEPDGDAVPVARGLLAGQLRASLEATRATRRARLELDNPRSAPMHAGELERLDFAQLDDTERRQCPPLLLVTAAPDPQRLAALACSDLPIKVLLLSDAADPRVDSRSPWPVDAVALIAAGYRRCFVAQSSIAYPQQLFEALSAAVRHPGPALLSVHAPSPAEHGFDSDASLARARDAVTSRSWPLFALQPGDDDALGTRLTLEHNPSPGEAFASDDDDTQPRCCSNPLDWLVGERRFARHFTPIDAAGGCPAPTPAAEYLALTSTEQARRTPFVLHRHSNQRLRPSDAALALARDRLLCWQALQQLAGISTPFREIVREETEREAQARHDRALAALAQQYEQRIELLRHEQTVATAERVRERLLDLAGYGNGAERER